MVRSLWSAATGMKSEQTAVDTIANNIANVNTTGFKAQDTQFKSLLYQTLQVETTSRNGETTPGSAQVGLGVRVSSVNSVFRQGAQLANENNMAMCINGEGFFQVRGADNNLYYTRDGNFGWTLNENGGRILTNQNGNPVMDVAGNRITLPDGVGTAGVSISQSGAVAYRTPAGDTVLTGQIVSLHQFPNKVGLKKVSSNLYQQTEASGAAINENTTNLNVTRSTMAQGYLEGSNVNLADEMVNLIISQRAYELNSRAITTSDSMLDTANNLKR